MLHTYPPITVEHISCLVSNHFEQNIVLLGKLPLPPSPPPPKYLNMAFIAILYVVIIL